MKKTRVAMIGFGWIAKSHRSAYEQLKREGAPVELVAVCDIDEKRFTTASATNLGTEKKADLSGIATYTDVDQMLAEVDFDMADICIPSYLHRNMAVKMMRAGKDVLSEKPMALCTEDCMEMIRVSKECDRRLMIGQCLRFEPSYLYLKKCIDEGTFGRLKNLFMDRLSVYPTWGFENWFSDTEKSGGCIMDLHIHDIDMARFLLGEPKAVSAVAYDGISRWQVINTRLFYDGVTVIANGSWDEASTVKFSAGFRARFENASVILAADGVTIYPDSGTPYQPELPHANRMAEEIRSIAAMSADRTKVCTANPPESAAKSVTLVEKLRESIALDGANIKIES